MENLWEADKLGRKDDADYIQRYLENLYSLHKRQEGFVLNINSQWGGGKTFFLQRLERQISSAGFMTVFYSAWENDYSSEPLLSFVATVEAQLSAKLPKLLKPKARGLAKLSLKAIKPLVPAIAAVIVRQLTGLSLEKLIEAVKSSDENDVDKTSSGEGENAAIKKIFGDVASKTADAALNDYKQSKISIEKFHAKLTKLVEEIDATRKPLPIFVFIDELDRCRPTFSIELLECVKHLFSVKGMYFLIATDTEQLSHAVSAVYGEKFESERYLKRFFDVEYRFRKPDYLSFSNYLGSKLELKDGYYIPPFSKKNHDQYCDAGKVIAGVFEGFVLDLRDQEQAYFLIHNICLSPNYEKIHLIFLAIIVALKIKNSHLYVAMRDSLPDQSVPADLRSIYKIQSVKFDTTVVHNDSGRFGQVSLLSILEVYLTMAGSTDREMSNMDWESRSSLMERNIVREMSGYNFGAAGKRIPYLRDYFDIVEQAGRLTLPLRE